MLLRRLHPGRLTAPHASLTLAGMTRLDPDYPDEAARQKAMIFRLVVAIAALAGLITALAVRRYS